MKTKFILTALLFSGLFSAQVGVNTTSPTATLDITAKNATGTTTTVDGLIVPRVDRQRAQSMTSVPTSTIIYVNDISTGTLTGTAINVDAVGLYTYNGTVWIKVGSGSSNVTASNGLNISSNDVKLGGNLSQSTTVTNNGNALNIAGSASTTTFASNGNVGIGTSSPTQKLQIQGNTRLTGMFYDGNNLAGGNGQVISSDGTKTIWVNNIAITPSVVGVMSSSLNGNPITGANFNTGSYIDLPSGKWSVQATILLNIGTTMPSGSGAWIRSGLSTSASSYIQPTFITSATLFSGSITGPNEFGLINGTVIINNTTGVTQRLYLWRLNTVPYNLAPSTILQNFGTNTWGENYIIAFPIN